MPFSGTRRPRHQTRFMSRLAVTRSVTISRRFAVRLVVEPFWLHSVHATSWAAMHLHATLVAIHVRAAFYDDVGRKRSAMQSWPTTPLFFVEPCPGPFQVLDLSRCFSWTCLPPSRSNCPCVRATRLFRIMPGRVFLKLSSGVAFFAIERQDNSENTTPFKDVKQLFSFDRICTFRSTYSTSIPPLRHRYCTNLGKFVAGTALQISTSCTFEVAKPVKSMPASRQHAPHTGRRHTGDQSTGSSFAHVQLRTAHRRKRSHRDS